jgi:hypothetical protein
MSAHLDSIGLLFKGRFLPVIMVKTQVVWYHSITYDLYFMGKIIYLMYQSKFIQTTDIYYNTAIHPHTAYTELHMHHAHVHTAVIFGQSAVSGWSGDYTLM